MASFRHLRVQMKNNRMKKFVLIISAASLLVACNNTPQAPVAGTQVSNALDTAGLAAYQTSKSMQAELPVAAAQEKQESPAVAKAVPARVRTVTRYVDVPVKRSTPKASAPVQAPASEPVASNTGSTASSSGDLGTAAGVGNESPAPAAEEKKKGWSKAAKGAVIGGVAGAVGGAVINKKNRGIGAVVGAVIGAGAGYGVGRSQDKKDGRIQIQ
jgi:hypothetical protein